MSVVAGRDYREKILQGDAWPEGFHHGVDILGLEIGGNCTTSANTYVRFKTAQCYVTFTSIKILNKAAQFRREHNG